MRQKYSSLLESLKQEVNQIVGFGSFNSVWDKEVNKKSIDNLIIDLLADNFIAVSIVESDSSRSLIKEFNANVKSPPRRSLTYKLIPARVSSIRVTSMRRLKQQDDHSLTLELDSWTASHKNLTLMAVVVTSRKGKSLLLDLVDITSDRHTGTFIASLAVQAVSKSGIPLKKFNSIVTDEAAACKVARREIVK